MTEGEAQGEMSFRPQWGQKMAGMRGEGRSEDGGLGAPTPAS